MTTTDGHATSRRRRPRAIEFSVLFGWHAVLSGAFVVAYLSGDEDTYAMHQFAGYLVLAAIVLRLVAGIVAPAGSPLRLPRPDLATLRDWMVARGGAARGLPKRPLLALMAVLLLIGIGVTACSGALADFVPIVEAIHEALGELALWIVLAHVALVVALHGVARWRRRSRMGSPAACPQRGQS
jgi:cytochrome b561